MKKEDRPAGTHPPGKLFAKNSVGIRAEDSLPDAVMPPCGILSEPSGILPHTEGLPAIDAD
ncbi:hypothetical protein RSSM_01994 [Rhodopirellula sallentina SM41]|uniref:Uncharacterized protein n=1 Tax=Rhodopirellula sallentina SM41 TaxID=1263870 RepID=M5UF97_9BACT|nr:hypothetical protein RSSM_01994 [Rhodopirellula sallentina SM41]